MNTKLITLLFLFTAQQLFSQDGSATKVLFIEGGGASTIFSLNFDTRFQGSYGFGIRAGFGGYYKKSGGYVDSDFSLPLGINYITKGVKHHFEIGFTTTITNTDIGEYSPDFSTNPQTGNYDKYFYTLHWIPVGYRYGRASGGFYFSAYLGPAFRKDFFDFPRVGATMGFTLKNKK